MILILFLFSICKGKYIKHPYSLNEFKFNAQDFLVFTEFNLVKNRHDYEILIITQLLTPFYIYILVAVRK